MRILGLITARGGSVRIPGKNMKMLGLHPLVAHSVLHALKSGVCEEVVVSTDDYRIANCSAQYGAKVVDRPPELSRGDQFMQLTVVKHALSYYSHCDTVLLLQPTSPLRKPEDVQACSIILENFKTVVSVTDCRPYSAFISSPLSGTIRPAGAVRPNGAIYGARSQDIRDGGHWFSDHTFGYYMPPERSIDIDTEQDFELARQEFKDAIP